MLTAPHVAYAKKENCSPTSISSPRGVSLWELRLGWWARIGKTLKGSFELLQIVARRCHPGCRCHAQEPSCRGSRAGNGRDEKSDRASSPRGRIFGPVQRCADGRRPGLGPEARQLHRQRARDDLGRAWWAGLTIFFKLQLEPGLGITEQSLPH